MSTFVSPDPEPTTAAVTIVSGTIAATTAPGPAGPNAEQVASLFLLTYKATTASAYAVDLKQWFAWCALFDVDPFDAVRAHVDAWSVHLADDGKARPATLARKISAIRNFYLYAVDSGYTATSPVPAKDKALHLPKVSRKSQTLGPDRDESAAMLRAAAERGARDEAVVAVLLYQGLRVSELCGIDVEDLSTQRGHRVVRLRRKGGEEQDQAVAPPAAGCLDAWLAERAAPTTGPVFTGPDGARLTRYQVEWIVECCAKAAGIDKRISPHSLRHACTTMLLDAGVPLRDIQVYMGHANSATTERYDLGRQHLDKSPAYALAGVFAG
ncbi:tyrosine-type recombinase/integrase [Catenulispora subtropica]|uniref:Tyrosine recombinase XerC n=1 Tax=Catenulispora subtropica TaxID=450798 RepID=A0ABP5DQS2_9ACTN